MIEYRKLPSNKWKEFKEFRLEALKNDWIAFGIAYEDEADYSEKQWKQKIKDVIFALNDNVLVAMILCKFETLTKMKHIAYIYDLYVKKSFRSKGVGKKLMEKAIQLIKTNPKIEKIKLIADPTQTNAINLYKKFGFKKTALIKRELKYKDKYYDDLHMEKWL